MTNAHTLWLFLQPSFDTFNTYIPMATTEPISDPVAAKVPDKTYPWWIENIDHKMTAEVCRNVTIAATAYD